MCFHYLGLGCEIDSGKWMIDAWDGKVLSSAELELDFNTAGLHCGLHHGIASYFCYILLSFHTHGFTIHSISYPILVLVLCRAGSNTNNATAG